MDGRDPAVVGPTQPIGRFSSTGFVEPQDLVQQSGRRDDHIFDM